MATKTIKKTMVSKFTEQELQRLENEQELKIYQEFQRAVGPTTGLPRLTLGQEKDFKVGNLKCSPLV
jgi:tRNA U34 2-thiouridine synthase MnmA/TrmU